MCVLKVCRSHSLSSCITTRDRSDNPSLGVELHSVPVHQMVIAMTKETN